MSASDQELRIAEAYGRLAARQGMAVDTCPYQANGDPDQRILAQRFVHAYVGAGGQVAADYDDGAPDEGAPRFRAGPSGSRIAVRQPLPDDDEDQD